MLLSLAANEYYDETAQIRFTVPNRWSEKALSQKRDILKVKYVHDDSPLETITFGYTDVWGSVPESDWDGLTREELNSEYFTSSDVASMYGTSVSMISTETYNNMKYYKCKVSQNVTEQGVSFELETTTYICIYNGFYYQFMYGSTVGEDHNYNDFKSMVKSAEYLAEVEIEPQETNSPVILSPRVFETPKATEKAVDTYKDYKEKESSPVALWIVLISLAVIAVVTVIKIKKQ